MNKIFLKFKLNLYFTYLFLILGSIIIYFPIYWTLITSFKLPISIINITYIPWIDFKPSLHAWKAVSEQAGVVKGFTNVLKINLGNTLTNLQKKIYIVHKYFTTSFNVFIFNIKGKYRRVGRLYYLIFSFFF